MSGCIYLQTKASNIWAAQELHLQNFNGKKKQNHLAMKFVYCVPKFENDNANAYDGYF